MMQPWFLVLIETLWNVNSYVTGHKWRRQGINRNIVECKCLSQGVAAFAPLRINRNIVECKFSRKRKYC